jgi:hypothetical protein
MALSILDGNQSATTLSTILSSGQHITAHTVVSLGTQAITDMRSAVSGSVVSIPSLPAISGTVTAGLSNAVSPSLGTPYGSGDPYPVGAKIIPVGGWTSEVDGAHWQALSLTDGGALYVYGQIAPSTNRIGVVTIGGGTVTIGAGTAQIGSVTASISNSVVTFYPLQGTSVSNTNFTSLTSSTSLVSAVANREVLTVFNEGAGNLHISPGATCTTISYQVRLSAGDYWECPAGQLSLAHTAVFATAGTARITQVS